MNFAKLFSFAKAGSRVLRFALFAVVGLLLATATLPRFASGRAGAAASTQVNVRPRQTSSDATSKRISKFAGARAKSGDDPDVQPSLFCTRQTPITFGQTLSGTLSAADDCRFPAPDNTYYDEYTFTANSGQQIRIEMNSTAFDTYLYLFSPSDLTRTTVDEALAENDNISNSNSNSRIPANASVFITLPETGTYTITANALPTTANPSPTGNYTLALTLGPGECPSTPINFGQTINGGLAIADCRLPDETPYDPYTFDAVAGQQVAVTMTSSAFNSYLYLLAPNRAVLREDDDSGGGRNARIPAATGFFTLPETGRYIILANVFPVTGNTSTTGAYALTLTAGAICSYTFSSPGQTFAAGGGTGSVNVTASDASCARAATTDATWITITGGASGTGNGTISYSVAANTGAARTGTISIFGQTYTITQADAAGCAYAIYPTVRPFTATSGSGRFTVVTARGCTSTAVSNASWITITAGSTGTGQVRYSVTANNTNATRIGTITVGGRMHSVTQTSVGTTPMVQFSGASFTANESDATKVATITVTRAGDDVTGAATVDYATVDNPAAVRCDAISVTSPGAAYARCDYTTTVDTLTFGVGERSKTFQIPILDDVHIEGDETFGLSLSNAQGATLGTQTTTTVTLRDNDTAQATTNPVNRTPFFVRQQYLDFLSREPEAAEPWTNVLNNCSDINNNPACDRITVSGAFFGSPEFRLKGFFVFLYYKASFGSLNNPNYVPDYDQIVPDLRRVSGLTEEEVLDKLNNFTEDWVGRTAFINAFSGTTNESFVDRLLGNLSASLTTPDATSGVTRNSLVNDLNAGTRTRAQVLRLIVESGEATAAQFNRAFVAMQYYGYLRRTPEAQGYQNNLNALETSGNSRRLINGFLNSIEYRLRFGPDTVQ